MDFSDHATHQEELMREIALKRAANVELSGPTAALSPEGPAQTQGSASD